MYIEFRLPTGGGGMGAQYVNWQIRQKLEEWAERYNVEYTTKNIKYTLRVTFEDESLYSLFALTFILPKEAGSYTNYRLIETLQFDRY